MAAMMWSAARRTIADPVGEIVTLVQDDRALTAGDVIALWRDDAAFRDFFIATLSASPYEAFFWELPPLTNDKLAASFECALIRSGRLARMRADDGDFSEHLKTNKLVAVFPNLGGDALLVAPRKIGNAEYYGHIAAFLRHAPREQQHALFQTLSLEVENRLALSRERFWISTAGLGVPWVHVRLDQRPKYYQFGRYRA